MPKKINVDFVVSTKEPVLENKAELLKDYISEAAEDVGMSLTKVNKKIQEDQNESTNG